MGSLGEKIVSFARVIFQVLAPFAKLLESEAQRLQGKGYYPKVGQEVSALLKLQGAIGDEQLVLFDVGANVGDYSIAFLEKTKNAEIHCFEPSKTAFKSLVERLSKKNVYNHKLALSDSSGPQPLFYDFAGSGWASLSKRDLSYTDIVFESSEMVDVDTLDNWVKRNQIYPNLLKIDVEGFELEVLKGASEVLELIHVIQFEFGGTNLDSRHFFKDYWDFFKQNNFQLYILTPLGIKEVIQYSEELECFKFSNYYAVNEKM